MNTTYLQPKLKLQIILITKLRKTSNASRGANFYRDFFREKDENCSLNNDVQTTHSKNLNWTKLKRKNGLFINHTVALAYRYSSISDTQKHTRNISRTKYSTVIKKSSPMTLSTNQNCLFGLTFNSDLRIK